MSALPFEYSSGLFQALFYVTYNLLLHLYIYFLSSLRSWLWSSQELKTVYILSFHLFNTIKDCFRTYFIQHFKQGNMFLAAKVPDIYRTYTPYEQCLGPFMQRCKPPYLLYNMKLAVHSPVNNNQLFNRNHMSLISKSRVSLALRETVPGSPPEYSQLREPCQVVAAQILQVAIHFNPPVLVVLFHKGWNSRGVSGSTRIVDISGVKH